MYMRIDGVCIVYIRLDTYACSVCVYVHIYIYIYTHTPSPFPSLLFPVSGRNVLKEMNC